MAKEEFNEDNFFDSCELVNVGESSFEETDADTLSYTPPSVPGQGAPSFTGREVHGGGGTKPPSEKQVRFAENIAKGLGVNIPNGYDMDWRICKDFIDENLAKYNAFLAQHPEKDTRPATPPSSKQLAFACKIAQQLNIELPKGIEKDWRIAREFIDGNKEKLPPRSAQPPSKKQVAFARSIAEQLGLELPSGYDTDWKVAKEFIDANKERLFSYK